MALFQFPSPESDGFQYVIYAQTHVDVWVLSQIVPTLLEKRGSGPQTALLQMNERAGQLNQSLIEQSIGLMPCRQPEFF